MVHRDLKFDNVLYNIEKKVKDITLVLVDFSESRGVNLEIFETD